MPPISGVRLQHFLLMVALHRFAPQLLHISNTVGGCRVWNCTNTYSVWQYNANVPLLFHFRERFNHFTIHSTVRTTEPVVSFYNHFIKMKLNIILPHILVAAVQDILSEGMGNVGKCCWHGRSYIESNDEGFLYQRVSEHTACAWDTFFGRSRSKGTF